MCGCRCVGGVPVPVLMLMLMLMHIHVCACVGGGGGACAHARVHPCICVYACVCVLCCAVLCCVSVSVCVHACSQVWMCVCEHVHTWCVCAHGVSAPPHLNPCAVDGQGGQALQEGGQLGGLELWAQGGRGGQDAVLQAKVTQPWPQLLLVRGRGCEEGNEVLRG